MLSQRNIFFGTVTPQVHYGHGKVEKKIDQLQQALERSELRNSRCTATGWQTLGKLIECTVNDISIGYLFHQSGGMNPLLRIMSPNNLILIKTGDRAPCGPFLNPNSAGDLMDNINRKYITWYSIWSECYLPLLPNRKKWHFAQ